MIYTLYYIKAQLRDYLYVNTLTNLNIDHH